MNRLTRLPVPLTLGVLLAISPTSAQQGGIVPGIGGDPTALPPGFPPGAPRPRGPGMPPRDNVQRTGTSRIRGRVFSAESGQPLRKALVRLTSPEIRESRSTTTAADGTYEFKELPSGRYTVNASKGSYVSLAYGQTRPLEPGRPITLADNQTIDRVDVRLPRGAVITGRVLDEFGEPVSEAFVSAMRQQYVQGRRQLVPVGRSGVTDDIGAFRLFGLAPGQYYLSVGPRGPGGWGDQSDERTGYAPTYYPGTSDPASAQRVTLGLGQTVSDLQIPLVLTPTARISGTALDAEGKPMTSGTVMAMPKGSVGPMGIMNGPIRSDGTFTVNGVPPGEYTVRAMSPRFGGGPSGTATASVSVGGQDVNGVQLVPLPLVAASGRISVDGADPSSRRDLRPEAIQVMLTPAAIEDAMGGGPPMMPARAKDDFSFEMQASPGRMLLRVMVPGGTHALSSVRVRGADVTDAGIDVRPGDDLSDIEVDLTAQLTEIAGYVTNAKGERLSNYTVIAFAEDRDKWQGQSRFISTGRPDQDGRFRVRGLPPSSYHIVALEYVEPGQWTDPEFLDRVKSTATSVTVGKGEPKTLDLRLADLW